jgi:hypothetical protein
MVVADHSSCRMKLLLLLLVCNNVVLCPMLLQLLSPGAAELDELPTDSLKRIRETYKAFKAVSSSWAAAAAQGDPARTSQHSAAGAVSTKQ